MLVAYANVAVRKWFFVAENGGWGRRSGIGEGGLIDLV